MVCLRRRLPPHARLRVRCRVGAAILDGYGTIVHEGAQPLGGYSRVDFDLLHTLLGGKSREQIAARVTGLRADPQNDAALYPHLAGNRRPTTVLRSIRVRDARTG